MIAIEASALTKKYGRRVAVDDLNLAVEQGELFALLGQNGAGKTTLIRMLCALAAPTSGDARLMGHSVVREAGAVKRLINVSPQETAVAPKLSVRENLELIARIYVCGRGEARERADEMLGAFHLAARADDRARALSGGMQRALSIAMALITQPEVLFLDEPTLGLDVRARRDLWARIGDLKGRATIVLTTHYLEEAAALADRIGILSRGRLRALGSKAQIQARCGAASLEDAFLRLTEEEGEGTL